MTSYEYAALFLAGLGHAGLGRAATRGRDPIINLMVGLLLSGGVASTLAWISALLVRPFLQLVIAAGAAYLIFDLIRPSRKAARPSLRWLVAVTIGTVIAALALYDWHFRFHSTVSEDLYFAPFVEMLRADYPSTLRAFTYYPATLAGLHITTSAVWAALCAFIPDANMIHGIEARYILGAVIIGHVGAILYLWLARPAWQFIPIALGALFLIHGELRVSFATSSQIYFLVILQIAAIAATSSDDENASDMALDAFVLAISLTMLKTLVIYIPVILAGYYALRLPRIRFAPAAILMSIVSMAQILSSLARPRAFSGIDIGFSLANPFSVRPTLDYHLTVILGDDPMSSMSVIGVLVVTCIFYMTKATLIPVAAFSAIPTRTDEKTVLVNGMIITAAATLLGWVLVRNGQHGTSHVVWLPRLGVAPMAVGLIILAARQNGLLWRIGIAAAVAFFAFGLGQLPWQGTPSFGGLSYEEFRSTPPENLLVPREGEQPAMLAERSLLLGIRLPAGKFPLETTGAMMPFILTDKE